MGKKQGNAGDKHDDAAAEPKAATAFVLRVPMHCRCDGCADKIRAAVKDLTLRCPGIQALDQSALATKGELAVLATADPEKLRRRLRKATGKSVDLLLPKPAKEKQAPDAAAIVQALLGGMQQQQPVMVPGAHLRGQVVMPGATSAWDALQQHHHQQQAYPYPYPWAAVQQQQQQQLAAAEAYSLPSYSYPAAAWGGAYAYPQSGLGGGWHGY